MIKTISTLFIMMITVFPSVQEKQVEDNSHFVELSVENISKKWLLDKHKIFFRSYPPAENEKGDYIYFDKQMIYTSVSEGIYDEGTWQLDKRSKRIFISSKNEKGELIFIIKELSKKKLVLVIDDDSDSDTKYLKIHFRAVGNK
ncbi:hypothetical protein [Aquimarina celericrescens]|uniref:Lipocalin-like domain-containing protein n=1 Tax=Aquimarina celericrescens TaxID=1964542 RepID=A0ABW5B124_9FLAO|nr:hypothetical protein [Aquimarina celericrescens]